MPNILKASDIVDNPNFVTPLPYLNFLRYFKRQHPKYGLRRLLQEGAVEWDTLNKGQKNLFQKQRILSRTARSTQDHLRKILKRLPMKKKCPPTYPIYRYRRNLRHRRRRT